MCYYFGRERRLALTLERVFSMKYIFLTPFCSVFLKPFISLFFVIRSLIFFFHFILYSDFLSFSLVRLSFSFILFLFFCFFSISHALSFFLTSSHYFLIILRILFLSLFFRLSISFYQSRYFFLSFFLSFFLFSTYFFLIILSICHSFFISILLILWPFYLLSFFLSFFYWY